MTNDTQSDLLATAKQVVARLSRGEAPAGTDAAVLQAMLEELSASRQAAINIAAWLRARAEISVAPRPDGEDGESDEPEDRNFSRGWAAGSYNNLHIAANAVEDGRAALPREQWPPYLRGEKVRRASDAGPKEPRDASTSPSA